MIFLLYFIILENKQKEERFGTNNSWTLQKNYKFGKKETSSTSYLFQPITTKL